MIEFRCLVVTILFSDKEFLEFLINTHFPGYVGMESFTLKMCPLLSIGIAPIASCHS